jgi:dTDP-4-dehydrorhamnose reductase
MLSNPSHDDRLSILLIGANGQLGRELLGALKTHGRIVATIRPGAARPPGYESKSADMIRSEQLRALVREVRPDWIVNAAAYAAVDAAESQREMATAVNAIAPGVLAEEAAESGAALIHYSTDYVFSGVGQRAWREDDPTHPINFYGLSKLAGEEAIRQTGARHLIIRTSWLYGRTGQNFVTKMLQLAAERDELTVVDDQIGAPTSARFVADVTGQIIAQARNDLDLLEARGGTLHVTCAGETSWHGFAGEIFRLATELGLPVKIPRLRAIPSSSFVSPAKRPLNSRLDTRRLFERFSIVPPGWEVEFRTSFRELYERFMEEARMHSKE